MVKHSRQRDAIMENLCSRFDHPTAEDIYFSLKPEMPALSLATVYRNLAQLESDGKILRIESGTTKRFDGNTNLHYHLSCLGCGGVYDVVMDNVCGLCQKATEVFDGKIVSHSVLFTGYCSSCSKQAE